MLSKLARFFIRSYQLFFSPFLHTLFGAGSGCIYSINCSRFAIRSFEKFNFTKAIQLSLLRILNCHPFSRRRLKGF